MKKNNNRTNTCTFGTSAYLKTLLCVLFVGTVCLIVSIPFIVARLQLFIADQNIADAREPIIVKSETTGVYVNPDTDPEVIELTSKRNDLTNKTDVYKFLVRSEETLTGEYVRFLVMSIMVVVFVIGITCYSFCIYIPIRDAWRKYVKKTKKTQTAKTAPKKRFAYDYDAVNRLHEKAQQA